MSEALGFDVPFNNLLVSNDLSIFKTCTELEIPYRSKTYSDGNGEAKVTRMVKGGHSNSTFAQGRGEGLSEKANKIEQYFEGEGGGAHPNKRSFYDFF